MCILVVSGFRICSHASWEHSCLAGLCRFEFAWLRQSAVEEQPWAARHDISVWWVLWWPWWSLMCMTSQSWFLPALASAPCSMPCCAGVFERDHADQVQRCHAQHLVTTFQTLQYISGSSAEDFPSRFCLESWSHDSHECRVRMKVLRAELKSWLHVLHVLQGIVHIQLQLGGMALTVCALFWPKWQQLHLILVVPLGLWAGHGEFRSFCRVGNFAWH